MTVCIIQHDRAVIKGKHQRFLDWQYKGSSYQQVLTDFSKPGCLMKKGDRSILKEKKNHNSVALVIPIQNFIEEILLNYHKPEV